MVSGIVYVIRNALPWKDAPPGYGPHKTLYNRFVRWSRMGVFERIFAARRLAEQPLTLDELADELGVSRERVRQLEARAFEKVRQRVIQVVGAAHASKTSTPAREALALVQAA